MKKKILSIFLVLFNVLISFSQTDSISDQNFSKPAAAVLPKMNNVKISLTSLAFNNYQFQYERILTKRISVVLGYGFIPKGNLPFESKIKELVVSNDYYNSNEMLSNAKLGYAAFTPEIRLYLGRGYGKGFYFAPFYRHLKYTVSNVKLIYDTEPKSTASIDMSGSITANTLGLQMGAQFNLGKYIVLDWWILGLHKGSAKGDLVGNSNRPLSGSEQESLKKELDNIDLPYSNLETTVNSNGGAKINISGPWAGIRSGISLGYKF